MVSGTIISNPKLLPNCSNYFYIVPKRQKDVLKLLIQGKDEVEISKLLGITYYTVRSHLSAIRNKLVAGSKSEVIAKCWSTGLAYEL